MLCLEYCIPCLNAAIVLMGNKPKTVQSEKEKEVKSWSEGSSGSHSQNVHSEWDNHQYQIRSPTSLSSLEKLKHSELEGTIGAYCYSGYSVYIHSPETFHWDVLTIRRQKPLDTVLNTCTSTIYSEIQHKGVWSQLRKILFMGILQYRMTVGISCMFIVACFDEIPETQMWCEQGVLRWTPLNNSCLLCFIIKFSPKQSFQVKS